LTKDTRYAGANKFFNRLGLLIMSTFIVSDSYTKWDGLLYAPPVKYYYLNG
jgi:hypothetical protein